MTLNESVINSVDHLIYTAPNLEAAIDDFEARWGVRASIGGQHKGRGTRNALIRIGNHSYLEIIAPDPTQSVLPQWFGLTELTKPRLMTWANKVDDVEGVVTAAEKMGLQLGAVSSGNRQRPDGVTLSWQSTQPGSTGDVALVPFFIQWESVNHPSVDAPIGPRLVELRGEHPDPGSIKSVLQKLNVEFPVFQAPEPALIATFAQGQTEIELR